MRGEQLYGGQLLVSNSDSGAVDNDSSGGDNAVGDGNEGKE